MLRQRTEQFQAQLDSFPTLPRAWILAIAAALIAGGVYFVSTTASRPTSEPLFGGGPLHDFDLDQVELAFGAAGLKGWRREEQQIYVPSQSRHEYLAALQSSSALPYSLHSAVESALQSGSFFESDSVRRLRTRYAKAQDLGNKLSAFDDVQWASVDYDEQDAGGFGQKLVRSASVVVVSANGKPLPAARIRMIQEFIAAAYAGMSSDDVVVTDTMARESVAASDPASVRRSQAEHELEEKIARLLTAYGKIHVAVKLGNDPRVSIGISDQQLHSQWRSRYVAEDAGAETVPEPSEADWNELLRLTADNVKSAVAPLLATDQSTEPAIKLWVFPAAELQAGDVEYLSAAPAQVDWINELKEHPTAAIAVGSLFIVALVVACLSIRLRTQRQAVATDDAVASDSQPRRSSQEDGTLREDLAELVEANPELAAQIVHGWMAEAA